MNVQSCSFACQYCILIDIIFGPQYLFHHGPDSQWHKTVLVHFSWGYVLEISVTIEMHLVNLFSFVRNCCWELRSVLVLPRPWGYHDVSAHGQRLRPASRALDANLRPRRQTLAQHDHSHHHGNIEGLWDTHTAHRTGSDRETTHQDRGGAGWEGVGRSEVFCCSNRGGDGIWG